MLIEVKVSRLHGHSSSSGANFIREEADCLALFEERLIARGLGTRAGFDTRREQLTQQMLETSRGVIAEAQPAGETIWNHVFAARNTVKENG
jgi:2-oxoisovalerate dehydrogenase E1 component alpha subunit